MKTKRTKRFILTILSIMLIFTLLGCSKTEDPDGDDKLPVEGEARDTITVLVQAEPPTLDPAYANNESIALVQQYIFENLFELKPDGTLEEELLESHEFEDDTTVKFKLKEGIKFSDGTELTSEDVLFTIKRNQESAVSQSQYNFINLEESFIEDDLNFVLKLHMAWAPFSNTFCSGRGSLYSKAAFEALGEETFARSPVATGPYKVTNWVSGTQIELTRNEHYWGEAPKTENIIIKFIPESTARVIELETGAADISYFIEGSDIDRVNAIDGYHIEMGDSYRYFTLLMSMEEPLFEDVRVREAMALAINKDALVASSTNGVGITINGYCPPVMEGYMEAEEVPYDVEEAKRLMAEAGYSDGFTIDLHVEPQPLYQRIAEAVQAMWADIGIEAKIVVSPLATYDAQNEGKFQASMRDGTASEISNVLIIYESSFGSRLNGNDEWLDEKLLELRTYYYGNPKREECLKEIYDYLDEKRYSYPFMVMPTVYGVSDKLEGFEFSPTAGNVDPKNWVVYE